MSGGGGYSPAASSGPSSCRLMVGLDLEQSCVSRGLELAGWGPVPSEPGWQPRAVAPPLSSFVVPSPRFCICQTGMSVRVRLLCAVP